MNRFERIAEQLVSLDVYPDNLIYPTEPTDHNYFEQQHIREHYYDSVPTLVTVKLFVEQDSKQPYAAATIEIKNGFSNYFTGKFKGKLNTRLKELFDFFEIRNCESDFSKTKITLDVDFLEDLKNNEEEMKAFAKDVKDSIIKALRDMSMEESIDTQHMVSKTFVNGMKI